MAIKPGLQLKLGQHLALTPQLQQSIRLLQLSSLELSQEIEQALNDNPLLECDDPPVGAAMRIAADGAIVGSSAPSAATGGTDAEAGEVEGEQTAGVSTLDWGSTRGERDEDDEGPGAWAATPTSLREHLYSQLAATTATSRDRALVQMLIESLDEQGYLAATLEELLAICPAEADVEPEDLVTALRLLQSFDPAGVGARNAAECLTLQLDALASQSPPPCPPGLIRHAKQIVSDHLHLLASREFQKLARTLELSEEAVLQAHALIRRLNPHPGVGFNSPVVDYIVPDILVKKIRNRWVAQVNPEMMPRLRLNQAYAAAVKQERSKEGFSQWSSRLQEARWLIRNIQQRFETIQRVAQAIVDRQHGFFGHGAIAMRPLVLREIAETLDLHESTISRVTTNKYMSTPYGVFELKYFFGSHVATDTGGAASSTAIRALIKQLIGDEDPKDPLSDSRIAELLAEQGIVVARRTVAKYREALKIPAVALRKSTRGSPPTASAPNDRSAA
jgi:RNA polymerase sigma-54 factor